MESPETHNIKQVHFVRQHIIDTVKVMSDKLPEKQSLKNHMKGSFQVAKVGLILSQHQIGHLWLLAQNKYW